ncbi:GNAT family N-acetyltransferase [Acaryochloris marina NIES-2412]|uniref:GNAT family N-acetyltransferase n=1 Tax=Acaryochloris marina TaxID=155978 RepID=UPI0040590731
MKRFFIQPKFRGMQIGHRLLQDLKTRAVALHLPYLRESGVSQPEALELFTQLGYQQRGPFGQYQAKPYSAFIEKSLTEL